MNPAVCQEPRTSPSAPEVLGQPANGVVDLAVGGHALSWWGQDNCMWSNDYPHPNSSWPHSREIIDRDLGALSEDVLAKLVRENVCRLYNIMPPAPAVG